MKIFHYHPETGVYLGHGLADESPLEPGVWLIPAHATSTQPPEVIDGEQAVWTGETWDIQPTPEPTPEPILLNNPELPQPPQLLTPSQKLALIGLSIDELRELLSPGDSTEEQVMTLPDSDS